MSECLDGLPPGLERISTSILGRQLALSRTASGALVRVGAMTLERMLAADERANAITSRAHVAIARNMVDTLGDLKGVAMKFGQALSYMDFLLPADARRELRTLLVSSRPMTPALVSQVFLEEFGVAPRRLFAEWCAQPFAAGSIGQVHRARLHSGEEVAVKVQYPAIVDAISADLRAAGLLDRLSHLLFRAQQPGAFLTELSQRFMEECDYRLEAEHQDSFHKLWLGDPDLYVPRVHLRFCSKRVLVSELAHGETFESFSQHASSRERDRAGMLLWRFAFESIFRHGCFNADPHPGNYLFSNGRVILLDFGCVKQFPPQLITAWKGIVRAVLEGRPQVARQLWCDLGMIPNPRRFDFDYHDRMLLTLYEPWLGAEPFRFTPAFVERTWRALVLENPNRFETNVPQDWVFVNRLQWGLYSVLAHLEAEGSFREALLDLLYVKGEPRPEAFRAGEPALVM